MQADEEVNDPHQNPNDGVEDVDAEDESPILLQCRQIIDNSAQERVKDLAERLDICIPQCNEEVWIRSKYPCIKSQVANYDWSVVQKTKVNAQSQHRSYFGHVQKLRHGHQAEPEKVQNLQ